MDREIFKKLGHTDQLYSVKRLEYKGGVENGLKVIEIDNGVLSFTLFEDCCLDIGKVAYKGVNMSYICKNGYVNQNVDFANKYCGGMVYTCGLDSIGKREGYAEHGRIHNTRAKVVEVKTGEEIEIVGEVKDTAIFGQNLLLTRTIKTGYNSNKITVIDQIENLGFTDENYCILYHMNVGYPMLDDGTIILADTISTRGRTEYAKNNIDKWNIMENPIDGGEEQVFYHKLKEGKVVVKNQKIGKQITFTFDKELLDNLIEWKSMVSGEYALGIEPTTTLLDDEFKYKKIGKGEKIISKIEIEFDEI